MSCCPRWPRQVPSLSVICRCRWHYHAKLRKWKHGYNHNLDSWTLCWGLWSKLVRRQFAHWQAGWLAGKKSEGLAESRQAGWLADWQGSRKRGRQVDRQVEQQNTSQNCQNHYMAIPDWPNTTSMVMWWNHFDTGHTLPMILKVLAAPNKKTCQGQIL
jgi:hypothetical protein